MKRYLLFAFDNFYPGGGVNDLVGSYETEHDAFIALDSIDGRDNFQVVDTQTTTVWRNSSDRAGFVPLSRP